MSSSRINWPIIFMGFSIAVFLVAMGALWQSKQTSEKGSSEGNRYELVQISYDRIHYHYATYFWDGIQGKQFFTAYMKYANGENETQDFCFDPATDKGYIEIADDNSMSPRIIPANSPGQVIEKYMAGETKPALNRNEPMGKPMTLDPDGIHINGK